MEGNPPPLLYIVVSLIIGLTAESIAKLIPLWIFNPWWYFFIQVCLWEGVVYGLIAWGLSKKSIVIQMASGGVLGFLAEFVNVNYFHLWEFNEDIFSQRFLTVLLMSILWSFYVRITVECVKFLTKHIKHSI